MGLSFNNDMKTALPEYVLGTNRFIKIDKMLSENVLWKKEAYENLKKLFKEMIEQEASDMDFGGLRTNGKVWFRIYGDKSPSENLPHYDENESIAMIMSILSEEQKSYLFKNKNIDFALSCDIEADEPPFRFRGDVFYERNLLAVNFRIINQMLFRIKDLGLSEPIIRRLDLHYEKSGLFLITGIRGSGKSSTLDAIIDMNNHKNNGHIIIIGNPIEYIHTSDKCLITHREIGKDVASFQKGVIDSLRQDP
ncbi:MAG: twitching motility protein PilT, partial [Bacteroidetes bacterium]